MLAIRTILHPTDFSTHSAQAFQMACALARDYQARLIVLHVEAPPVAILGGMPALPPLPEEYDRENLEKRLRCIQPPDPAVQVEHRLVTGEPVAEILRMAQEQSCDLIVMGTHGRTGLGRLLMGSIAEQVVRKAPCLVLTVKSPTPNRGAFPPAGKQQPVQV
jgi:nucleotide-binding universal stress UspA family protein